MRTAVAMLGAVAALWAGAALSHPHGAVECRAEVDMGQGGISRLRGRLWLDEWHSQQAMALVRDAGGGVDASRMQRFAFALKMQLGRLNWLYELDADGQRVEMRPATDPEVVFDGGRVRITIDYALPGVHMPANRYSLHCADPTWYFVSAWGRTIPVAPPPEGAVADTDPQRIAARLQELPEVQADEQAFAVRGCASPRLGSGLEGVEPPRKGQARMDWSCVR